MTVKLIQIGNSKGFRLPKAMIDKYALSNELEIIETEEGLMIRPIATVRHGWEEQFASANRGDTPDDDFSDWQNVGTDFDDKEWEW